jgi:hypothetical protein
MKRFELILGLLIIASIALKLLHVPGSSLLLILTLLTLSMIYYVFSVALINGIKFRDIFTKQSYKSLCAKRIISAIGFGLAISVLIMGVLFKLQIWSGASGLLLIGLVSTGIILLISVFYYMKDKSESYIRIIKRIAIYGSFGLMMSIITTSTLVDIYYRDNPDYAELYKKILSNPDNVELQEQFEQMEKGLLEKEIRRK